MMARVRPGAGPSLSMCRPESEQDYHKPRTSEGSRYDKLIKLIIIGDSGVGKKSFARQFHSQEFNPRLTLPETHSSKTKLISDLILYVELWPRKDLKSVSAHVLRDAQGYLLLFDVTNEQSFDTVKDRLKEIKSFAPSGNPKFVLCGNKCDVRPRMVTEKDAETFAKGYGLPYYETSASTGQNVRESVDELLNILDVRSNPARTIHVREWPSAQSLEDLTSPVPTKLLETEGFNTSATQTSQEHRLCKSPFQYHSMPDVRSNPARTIHVREWPNAQSLEDLTSPVPTKLLETEEVDPTRESILGNAESEDSWPLEPRNEPWNCVTHTVTSLGGEFTCVQSNTKIEIPPGAVLDGESVQIVQRITCDVQMYSEKNVPGNLEFASPIIELTSRKKFVIPIAVYIPLSQELKENEAQVFSINDDEVRRIPAHSSNAKQQQYFTVEHKFVKISTTHFCKFFVCFSRTKNMVRYFTVHFYANMMEQYKKLRLFICDQLHCMKEYKRELDEGEKCAGFTPIYHQTINRRENTKDSDEISVSLMSKGWELVQTNSTAQQENPKDSTVAEIIRKNKHGNTEFCTWVLSRREAAEDDYCTIEVTNTSRRNRLFWGGRPMPVKRPCL